MSEPSPLPQRLMVATLLVAAAALFLTQTIDFWPYVNDDAYITLRYSDALARGRGPYFNSGERVEGYSNFLLMLLQSLVIVALGRDQAPLFGKLLGVACGFGILFGVFLIARSVAGAASRLSRSAADLAGLLAAGLIAVWPSFALNATSGLETLLFSLLLVTGVGLGTRAITRGVWCGGGVAFGAACLTRPEGAYLFACFWLAQAVFCWLESRGTAPNHDPAPAPPYFEWQRRLRFLVADAVIVALVVAAQLAFRLWTYDGQWVPNTYYAKFGGFARIGPWRYIREGALAPLMDWPGVLIALLGLVVLRPRWSVIGPLLAAAVAGALSPLLTGTDWMPGERLLMHYLPLVAIVGAIGWIGLLQLALPRLGMTGPALGLLLIPLMWWSGAEQREQLRSHVVIRARGFERGHRALADRLRRQGNPGDQAALTDIGIVGFRCPELRILDLSGLTDRFIAQSPGRFMDKAYAPRYVLDQRPRFIVLVLTAPGRSGREPPPGSSFDAWTRVEQRLAAAPEFRRYYVHKRSAPPAAEGSWADRFAARIGATKIFEHDYPGRYYLLALFERRS